MPSGKLTEEHYRRVHRHIFRDVYTWAGEYREKVRISKGDSTFCYLKTNGLLGELHGLLRRATQ